MGDLEPGSVFAGHRIEGVAGRGGMGVVYRATHLALDIVVAVKVIQPDLASDPDFRERFQRESRLAASIEHPNVLPVRHAGEEDGLLYITMRYVEGTDLRTLIDERGKVDAPEAVAVLEQICAALDAAHARGLVHRDVKPANVLIDESGGQRHAYLADFGLTRHAASKAGLTKTGHWVGTLDYVAPEQIEGKSIDARADVYALGCVFYEMLTGKVPYLKDTEVATMYAHLNDDPPRPSEVEPRIPKALDEVVARAMAKRPEDRYPSAGDMGRAAKAALEGIAVSHPEASVGVGAAAPAETRERPAAQTIGTPAPAPPPASRDAAPGKGRSRRRVLVALAGLGALVAIGVVLAVAGVFGGSGPSLAQKRADYIRDTLIPGFKTAFANQDTNGIGQFLAPDAKYDYPGFPEDTPQEEFQNAFDDLDPTNYQLNLVSLTSNSQTAAGATVATATLSYQYDHGDNVNTGKVEWGLTAPNGGDPRISVFKPSPDLYAYIDVPAADAPVSLHVVARKGRFGDQVATADVTLQAGKGQPVKLQPTDYSLFDQSTKIRFSATGQGANGQESFTGSIGYPYSD